MALSNPISSTDIANNFVTTIRLIANDSYGSGDNPQRTLVSGSTSQSFDFIRSTDKPTVLGGTKSDPGIEIRSDLNQAITPGAGTTGTITASTIFNTLNTEAAKGTNHRYATLRFLLQGSGGNSGTWGSPAAGTTYLTDAEIPGYTVTGGGFIMYSENHRCAMSATQRSAIANPNANTYNLVSGGSIDDTKLQDYFTALKDAIEAVTGTAQANTYYNWTCHTSCHNSCHSSRGRR